MTGEYVDGLVPLRIRNSEPKACAVCGQVAAANILLICQSPACPGHEALKGNGPMIESLELPDGVPVDAKSIFDHLRDKVRK